MGRRRYEDTKNRSAKKEGRFGLMQRPRKVGYMEGPGATNSLFRVKMRKSEQLATHLTKTPPKDSPSKF
jgi:hypothetical protein